jgi:hypothetical protein
MMDIFGSAIVWLIKNKPETANSETRPVSLIDVDQKEKKSCLQDELSPVWTLPEAGL